MVDCKQTGLLCDRSGVGSLLVGNKNGLDMLCYMEAINHRKLFTHDHLCCVYVLCISQCY